VSILAVLIKLLKYWYEQQHTSLQLLKEKTEAELAMLKGQINPHFLFNTLNNIYSLALKKSDLTAEAVVKLSEMLDYLLYECEADFVLIKKEIKLIQNYIYLQKIRYGDRLDIQFEAEDTSDQQIPPMILLPFIEGRSMHFYMLNSKSARKNKDNNQISGGIGLENVKKRLYLLYQNNYFLEIENLSDTFSVKLQIPIMDVQ
jgi:sensor histidine kinase YesM